MVYILVVLRYSCFVLHSETLRRVRTLCSGAVVGGVACDSSEQVVTTASAATPLIHSRKSVRFASRLQKIVALSLMPPPAAAAPAANLAQLANL